jgi:hypothetical protein
MLEVCQITSVFVKLLNAPHLPPEVASPSGGVSSAIETDYWQRAGRLRAKVLAKRRKARLGDALIAQSCIDRGISLLTRDRDFRAFAESAGLALV